MAKKYDLKIDNCWSCPSFEHVYVKYCFHCLETDKHIKYKDPEVDKKINELFNQCPLEEWE